MIVETSAPGVVALVNEGQVSQPLKRQPSSNAMVVGFAPWGPVGVRQVISNWGEFKRVFGGFHALGYMAEAAYVFFNLFRGKTFVAVRAAGEYTKASVTLDDRDGDHPFKFEALYPSSTVDIKVTVSDIEGDNDNVNIVIESTALGIKETYKATDLRDEDDLAALNAKSKLVKVTIVDDTIDGADGRPASGDASLANGNDDAEGVSTDSMSSYLSQFATESLGTGQVLIPGFASSANNAALNAHAEAYNRLALLDPELGSDYADAEAAFNAHPSTFAAAYYPWVECLDFAGSGVKKFYPPSIFAAGACAQVDATIGTHKAPANITVPTAIDVERNEDGTSVIDDNVRTYLNSHNINAIAPITNEGIKIYGARVLAPAGETRVSFVHQRRLLNLVYYTAKIGFAWAVFEIIDGTGKLYRNLVRSAKTFLSALWRDGALYGKTEQEAFIVVCDDTNNSNEDLDNGVVHVQLGVKISPTAEVVFINIDSVALGQDLSVLNGGN